ncbi:MAG: hypothetical protein COA86_14695 [Kangiella sp.]|nr:MAG: hypothetical protein COA86_14695 [Kangiella sp.]
MKNKSLIFLALSIIYSCNLWSHGKETGELVITDSSFSCIRDMSRVRTLYVSNLLGHDDATIAVANSKDGGEYPVGSVVQLVPTEVMVKRKKGFNVATKDWEFFELTVSKEGSKIDKRGFADVVNRFGGNCFACHIKAEPKWDFICETGHGCDPIPLTPDMISVIQKTDPRCKTNEPLNAKEIEAAGILKKMMGG